MEQYDKEKIRRRFCSDRGCPRTNMQATNWLADLSGSYDFDMVEVSFKNTRVGFYTNPDGLDLAIGDIVAVEGNPGHDIGRVTMTGRLVKVQLRKKGLKADAEPKKVLRLATQSDIEKFEQARSREHDTMIRSRKIAEDLGLNMKIGDVEYQGDGAKAIFYYIADERVDFRKLIRILADTFKVRIEMKQIGARQEAGRIGGIGPCGRPLCCASWMTHFVSVGTGAARLQDLSMNPQKLAGQCAKLKCCLNFETDTYAEAQKKLPPRDIALETKDALYYLFKQDILAGTVTYSTDRRVPANLVSIPASRAFEIIALNKQGIKVETLEREEDIKPVEKPLDLVEQESLTRFDKAQRSNKKKRRPTGKKAEENRRPEGNKREDSNPKNEGGKRPEGTRNPQGGKRPEGRNNPEGDRKQKEGQRPEGKRRNDGRRPMKKRLPKDENKQ